MSGRRRATSDGSPSAKSGNAVLPSSATAASSLRKAPGGSPRSSAIWLALAPSCASSPRQLRFHRRQFGALALQVQVIDDATLHARFQQAHALLQRGDVLARQADLALCGAQLEVVAHHIADEAQPGQIQQRRLAGHSASAASIERRTRPHRSSSQEASKPIW